MAIHRIVYGLHHSWSRTVDPVLTAYTLGCLCNGCHQFEHERCTIFARAQGCQVKSKEGSYFSTLCNRFQSPMCHINMELQHGARRPTNVHEYFERRRSQQKRAIAKYTIMAVCNCGSLKNWRTGIQIYIAIDKPFQLTSVYKNQNKFKIPSGTRCGQYLVKALKLKILRRGEIMRHPIFELMPALDDQLLVCEKFDGLCSCQKRYHHHLVNLDSVHHIGFQMAGGKKALHGNVQGIRITDDIGNRILERYNTHIRHWNELECTI